MAKNKQPTNSNKSKAETTDRSKLIDVEDDPETEALVANESMTIQTLSPKHSKYHRHQMA